MTSDKAFEIYAGTFAFVGSLLLAFGSYYSFLVIMAYVYFLISAVMYLGWSVKHKIYGILIMNIGYVFADVTGIINWSDKL